MEEGRDNYGDSSRQETGTAGHVHIGLFAYVHVSRFRLTVFFNAPGVKFLLQRSLRGSNFFRTLFLLSVSPEFGNYFVVG